MRYTRAVLGSGEDLLAIINNILDFSKIENGKLERVDNQPFSPTGCVERVSDLLVARASLGGLELSHECGDDVPAAMLGDGKRLRQVLTNMIGNSIKFTERGRIVVRTTLVERSDVTSTIRFEVVDTGIGIPSHLHEHIFEGFSQADSSTTRQFQGTGLGLSISKRLVELMGGTIGLISRPGVGSNFWFTIKGDHCRPLTAADRDLTGIQALVVATDDQSRDTVQHQLTAAGAAVVEVQNADDALAVLRADVGDRRPFDVALVDIRAEEGLALAREIRAEATQSLPLVLVSIVERSKTELRQAGIDAALSKPIKEAELLGCVARGLRDAWRLSSRGTTGQRRSFAAGSRWPERGSLWRKTISSIARLRLPCYSPSSAAATSSSTASRPSRLCSENITIWSFSIAKCRTSMDTKPHVKSVGWSSKVRSRPTVQSGATGISP